jgi:uncharacterized protein Veg
MNKKPQLLQHNKLDQIIICSITACLNLNDNKSNPALTSIFRKYNSVTLSLHSNREMGERKIEERPMTLLEFYNKVFIHEVQDMMSKEEQPRYLCTPIREIHFRHFSRDAELPTSPWLSRKAPSVLGGECLRSTYREQ